MSDSQADLGSAGGGSLRRPRAYQAIVDDLQQQIVSGELKPGARLPSERDLVTKHSLSRSSVREALRVLESMHLIATEGTDRRASVVQSFSIEPARRTLSLMTKSVGLSDLLQFRMVADAAASLLAARRRTSEQLVLLERNMARMRAALADGYDAFSAVDVEFHELVAEMSGNDVIRMCADTVRESCLDLIQQSMLVSENSTALMLQTIGHHRDVFDAISIGDGALASRLTRESLYYYAAYLEEPERSLLAALVTEVGGKVDG